MNWLQSILYGLVVGVTEFLPVSSQAHEVLLLGLFGEKQVPPLLRLMVHLAALLALVTCCQGVMRSAYKELALSQRPKRRRSREPNKRTLYDIALIRTAFYPLALGYFCYPYTSRIMDDMQWVALFLLLNGIILFLPPYIRSGNKDSLSMSRVEGVLFGISAGFGVIPGISRVGAATTMGSICGADRQHTLHWTWLLSIPAFAFMLGFDLRDIVLNGLGISGIGTILQCVFSGAFSYAGAFLGVQTMRFLSVNTGYSGFAYYCWGSALFTFILFLI